MSCCASPSRRASPDRRRRTRFSAMRARKRRRRRSPTGSPAAMAACSWSCRRSPGSRSPRPTPTGICALPAASHRRPAAHPQGRRDPPGAAQAPAAGRTAAGLRAAGRLARPAASAARRRSRPRGRPARRVPAGSRPLSCAATPGSACAGWCTARPWCMRRRPTSTCASLPAGSSSRCGSPVSISIRAGYPGSAAWSASTTTTRAQP